MRSFKAKFSGVCKLCGKPFKAGEDVAYRKAGAKNVIGCATGICAQSTPAHYCQTCGHELGVELR